MKSILLIPALMALMFCCSQNPTLKTGDQTGIREKAGDEVKMDHHDSLTIPAFFQHLVTNHLKDFTTIQSEVFNAFCTMNRLNANDPSNSEKYFTVKILHDLFTSQTASDCSSGDILNIPYQWNWVTPNPRHEIYFVSSNTLLTDMDPPSEFSKYNSYADIDRTPYLYLSDLVNPTPKYYSASCGTFSTFGWCSEREMAFVSLLELLGYTGKIIAEGNHSWSEFIIPMISVSGSTEQFKVTVDNTFNSVYWEETDSSFINEWRMNNWNSTLEKWYNQKAHSQTEKSRINNHLVPKEAALRIENKLSNYLEKRKQIVPKN